MFQPLKKKDLFPNIHDHANQEDKKGVLLTLHQLVLTSSEDLWNSTNTSCTERAATTATT